MKTIGPVVALTLAALGLRVFWLGRLPLWFDEGISLLLVTDRPFSDWLAEVHPPLYYALLVVWTQVSTSDRWLRVLSAVLGALTIPALYVLGARLLGRASALWAAGFLTVTWLHVWHSREARMYPLLVLAFTLALWGLVAGARDGKVAGWVVYVLGASATAWSHGIGIYYAVILAGLGLVMRPEDGRAWSRRSWLLANTAVAGLFAPWVPAAFQNSREVASSFWLRPIAPEPPVLTTIYDLTVAPIGAPGLMLRTHLGLDVSPTLGAGLWLVPIFAVLALAIVLRPRDERSAVRFLVLAYLAPIGVFTALSLMVRPILLPRILLPAAVPLVLLLAVGVRAVPWPRAQRATGILVGLMLLLGTVYGLRHDVGTAEGWREASRYLQAAARAGDALVIQPSHLLAPPRESGRARERAMGEMLLLRYDESGRLRGLPRLSTPMVMHTCQQADVGACMDAALRAAGTSGHVWVILRDAPLPDAFRRWLDDGLERGPVARFRSIVIERCRLRG